MKIKMKDLLKQLADSYPQYQDMNTEGLLFELAHNKSRIKEIYYGQNYGPISPVHPWSSGLSGFRIILENGSSIHDVMYGPRLKDLLEKYALEFDVEVK